MNAVARVGAAVWVLTLLVSRMPAARGSGDVLDTDTTGHVGTRWERDDGHLRPAAERRFQTPTSPDRRFDQGWIERLNAHSEGARARRPGTLPLLPRWAPGQGTAEAGLSRVPAEFEPQEALLLPVGLLADEAPEVLTGLMAATRRRAAVVGIVADAGQRDRVAKALHAQGLPQTGIQFAELPHNTKWIRDYGPIFVRLSNHRRAAIDTEYPETGRDDDDAIPVKLAERFRARLIPAQIVFEGGNLLSNGEGLCVTTTAAIFRNSDQEDSEARVCRVFRDCFGAEQTVFLEPLMGEQTGHVDMFACFTAPDVIVVGTYAPELDALNAALLNRNAERLEGLPTPRGPLRVVRIPMPPHKDGNWRTYTNVVFANGALLMPTYRGVDRAGRETAFELFARLLPGWEVIGIDCTTLIRGGGALRCISTGVPLDVPRAPAAMGE